MNKNLVYVIIVVVLLILILFFSFGNKITTPNYININGKEAITLVNDGAVIIDVRTKEEYDSKHIKGALNIPLDEINKIDIDTRKKIIVYCRSGNRSKKAATELIKIGFTKVYDLGSIDNWPGEFE